MENKIFDEFVTEIAYIYKQHKKVVTARKARIIPAFVLPYPGCLAHTYRPG